LGRRRIKDELWTLAFISGLEFRTFKYGIDGFGVSRFMTVKIMGFHAFPGGKDKTVVA
jgi:hypothetical protein